MGTKVYFGKKGSLTKMTQNKKNLTDSLTETDLSEIIQMALSDHVTFSEIESQYGLRAVSYTHLTLPTIYSV